MEQQDQQTEFVASKDIELQLDEEAKDENFQMEEIEDLNKKLIKEQLEKQLEAKLAKIDKEISNYEEKLNVVNQEIQKQQNSGKLGHKVKENQSKTQFYLNQINQLRNRKQKLSTEYDTILQSNGDDKMIEAFFSHKQESNQVQQKHKRSLIEITIDGYQKYYVSELFHSLLFKHQVEALYWMLSQHTQGKGSILADEMGLGKTISAIALITTLYTTHWETFNQGYVEESAKLTGPILIVCPATVISQWVQELKLWTSSLQNQIPILTFQGDSTLPFESQAIKNKSQIISEAFKHNGIVITSYEFLRSEQTSFQRKIWFYIILDEAQKIKNSQSLIHKAVTSIQANRRLILTGTPMQNNLSELWSLFNFVQPGLLGELDYFENTFCKAIVSGGFTNASKVQQETSKQCLMELRDIIQRHILRRTKKQLKTECQLPDRNEFIVFCSLTQAQLNIYEKYLEGSKEYLAGDFSKSESLKVLNNLRKICNHPFLYFAYHENPHQNSYGFKFSQQKIAHIPEFRLYTQNKKNCEDKNKHDLRQIECELAAQFWQLSGKLRVLINFLRDWYKRDPTTKVLIFSQTKKILDIIQVLAQKFNFSYLRMDGDVSLKQRMEIIDRFNHEDHFLFILTTRVGGLGINLTAANKVIIFDPDWNPMVDVQATDRALRIGQKRDVTIYRFVVDDTIEEKIYHRQIFKKFMADKVLQDPSKQKLFERAMMHELFEMPQKTINTEREQRLLNKHRSSLSMQNLEEETKLEMKQENGLTEYDTNQTDNCEDDDEDNSFNPQLQKMYKISKKNVMKDEKLKEYMKKTEQELKEVEESTSRVKKDLESDLISMIFKEQQNDENQGKQNSLSISHLKVKMEAKQAASHLLAKIGGSYQNNLANQKNQQMTSSSILSNLLNKKQNQSEGAPSLPQSKIELKDQIKKLFTDNEVYELPTDQILESFKQYIEGDLLKTFKQELKKVAFFDKQEKLWILKD